MLYNRMSVHLTTLQYELMKLLSSVTNQTTIIKDYISIVLICFLANLKHERRSIGEQTDKPVERFKYSYNCPIIL